MNGVGHFKSSTAPIEEACLPIRFRDCRTFSSAMSASSVSQVGKSYGAVARRSCRLRRAAEAGYRPLGANDGVPRSDGRPWKRDVPRAPLLQAEIGRATGGEGGCPHGETAGGAVS